ncbi:MAG TPA: diacylglycerol kinase family protein [Thermoanaerobaculia bacterium]
MHLKLLYNPMAGRGRARKRIAEAEAYLRGRGARVDCTASENPLDLVRLAAESSRGGYDRVVICGGDGSLNMAIREFDLAQGILALIPGGSGDDFGRVCGIPRNVRRACDVVLDGDIREVDVALANNHRYLGVAGFGFDSEVAAYANRNAKYLRGSLVYLYSIFRVLPKFRPHTVRINGVREESIMFACVGNSRQYGGGIRIVPHALIDDGQLDAVIVHRTSRVQLLKTLPRAYNGSHVKNSYVEEARGTEFRFESETPLEVYADGEPLTQTPVVFGLAAERLRFVVPRVTGQR